MIVRREHWKVDCEVMKVYNIQQRRINECINQRKESKKCR